jgi:membrane protease YdiL (CAAX protease family)
MLFLLKRTVLGSLLGLTVLLILGLALRQVVPAPTPLEFSLSLLLTGVLICGVVLCSDGLTHGTLRLLLGRRYLERFEKLAAVFREQSVASMVTGALMAGLGEEMVFRGMSVSPLPVLGLAVLFGLLHHIRWELGWFTVWSIWEGALFALALLWVGSLLPTMVAHFLHDLIGFGIFRRTNRVRSASPAQV